MLDPSRFLCMNCRRRLGGTGSLNRSGQWSFPFPGTQTVSPHDRCIATAPAHDSGQVRVVRVRVPRDLPVDICPDCRLEGGVTPIDTARCRPAKDEMAVTVLSRSILPGRLVSEGISDRGSRAAIPRIRRTDGQCRRTCAAGEVGHNLPPNFAPLLPSGHRIAVGRLHFPEASEAT
jgi:hypothetical protein